MLITENGMPTDDGAPRTDGVTRAQLMRDTLYWVQRARADGVTRTPTDGVDAYRSLIEQRGVRPITCPRRIGRRASHMRARRVSRQLATNS